MRASVIIPTYNRCAALRETLLSLSRQSYPDDLYRVIVVDDGSTDSTGEMVHALHLPYRLIYLWQPNRGRCAARNRGIAEADGDLILFLDGDMIANPDLLAEHVRSHTQKQRVLVRGDIRTCPSLITTPFMRYGLATLDDVGHLADPDGFLPFGQALTGNLSIKREHLAEIGGFDESLDAGYAWDDVDLGYRAERAGLHLLYNPRAISFHLDRVSTLEQQCERVRHASRTFPMLISKYPELRGQLSRYVDKEPIRWNEDSFALIARKLARSVIAARPLLNTLKAAVRMLERFCPSPALLRRGYWLILGSYALKGYREGLRSIAQ